MLLYNKSVSIMNDDEGLINTDLKSVSIMIISVICVLSFFRRATINVADESYRQIER